MAGRAHDGGAVQDSGGEMAGMSGAGTEKVDKTIIEPSGARAAGRAEREVFSGVGVALVTIFDSAGAVDPAATATLAADLANRGMRAILVAGTTGEAGTITTEERTALIRAVRDAVEADVPVLAGTGAATTEDCVGLTKAAVIAGADAVLAFPPPAQDLARATSDARSYSASVADHYAAVAAATEGRPVFAYHVPWISAPGVPVGDLAALPIAGIKDSSGSADRLLDELAHYDGATYVGSSALLALAGPMGGAGAILALANVEPERCIQAFAGDAAVQRDLADVHLKVREGGPAELKRMLGRDAGYCDLSRVA
ncbi:MAG TPA: dihydrodipicolinate synthase family protein [Streptosporangiaceae bacterium]